MIDTNMKMSIFRVYFCNIGVFVFSCYEFIYIELYHSSKNIFGMNNSIYINHFQHTPIFIAAFSFDKRMK